MKQLSLKEAKKVFPVIGKFIQEVFGEREQQVYDWLSQVKFKPRSENPRDKTVMIVTGPPASGKTTFLEVVRALFAWDAVEVAERGLFSDYNSHWITKSMVCIDGVSLNKLAFSEKIKMEAGSMSSIVTEKCRLDTAIRPRLHFLLATNNLEGAKNLVSENRKAFIIETTGGQITPSPKEFLADKNQELSLIAKDELNKLTDYLYINFQK